MNGKEIKFLDLFGGVGGFRLGLEKANNKISIWKTPTRYDIQSKRNISNNSTRNTRFNTTFIKNFRCVGYCDNNKYCTWVYNYNFKENHKPTDITKVSSDDIPEHDLLCAGFPCQAFSIAGKRHGFEDTRGTLFFEIARILRDKKPKMVLLENVKGLLSHDKGKTFHIILRTLAELGYVGQYEVLNSKNFGVPQNRERVFIFGFRGKCPPQIFPLEECYKKIDGMEKQTQINELTGAGSEISRIYGTDGLAPTLHNKTGGWQEPKIAQALDANYSKGTRIRRLTPTECERLQGFPDNWTKYGINEKKKVEISDTQRYKMMGNAVTVNVIQAIGERICVIESEEH